MYKTMYQGRMLRHRPRQCYHSQIMNRIPVENSLESLSEKTLASDIEGTELSTSHTIEKLNRRKISHNTYEKIDE